MWLDEVQAVVYACYDTNGRLIYIGHTANLQRRIITHKSSSSWWCRVGRVVPTKPMSLRRARQLEATTIARLRPMCNKRRNPDWYAAGQSAEVA